jgi:hypothetical protein
MFQKAMKYLANYVAGVFNLYCIPKLVGYNFPTTEFPQMRVRNIGETKDLQMFASAHANLLKQTAITLNLETENWYREALDMPLITQEEWDTGQETLKAKENNFQSNGKGSGGANKGDSEPGSGDTSVDSGFDSTRDI